MTVVTRRQSPELRLARSLLADLATTCGPGVDALPAIEALATLDQVAPPHPPAEELASETTVTVQDALDALGAAAHSASHPGEAARITAAAQALTNPVSPTPR